MHHFTLLALLLSVASLQAADGDGFVSMFNGRDLTGWTNVNCAPETWSVKEGVIHCTGHPIGALRTLRHYENFILEAEWRHLSSGGNSGMFMWASPISAPGVPFLRAVEVQVLDHGYAEQYEKETGKKSDSFTTHGDVFPIHGSSMNPFGPHRGDRSFPTEERSKRTPEWNHYRIVGSNGVLRLSVNGKEVSGGENCNYRKGYLGLESEGAPVEFRNLRIKELPSNHPNPELVAPLDPGWVSLYNGSDLRGWRNADAAKARWQSSDWHLVLNAGTGAATQDLWTEGEYQDVEFTLDVKPGAESSRGKVPTLLLRGRPDGGTPIQIVGLSIGKWTRVRVRTQGREATLFIGDREVVRVPLPAEKGTLGIQDIGVAVEFGNIHVHSL